MQPDMKIQKYEAFQKQKYLESKIDMIPATLKEIYTEVGGKSLVARELYINDKLLLGIEYAPSGTPVSAYSTDKNGKKIVLDKPMQSEKQQTLETLANRLNNIKDKAQERTQSKTTELQAEPTAKAKKTVRKLDDKTIAAAQMLNQNNNSK